MNAIKFVIFTTFVAINTYAQNSFSIYKKIKHDYLVKHYNEFYYNTKKNKKINLHYNFNEFFKLKLSEQCFNKFLNKSDTVFVKEYIKSYTYDPPTNYLMNSVLYNNVNVIYQYKDCVHVDYNDLKGLKNNDSIFYNYITLFKANKLNFNLNKNEAKGIAIYYILINDDLFNICAYSDGVFYLLYRKSNLFKKNKK